MGAILNFLSSVPLDWFVLLGIALLVAIDAMRSGPRRAIALSLALPITLVLYSMLEQTRFIGSIPGDSALMQALAVAILFAMTFVFISRMIDSYTEGLGILAGAMAGAAATIVLIVVWHSIDPLVELWSAGALMRPLFNESYQLLWLVGAYAALAFASN